MRKAEEVKRLLRLDRYWRPEVVEALLDRSDEVVAFDPQLGLEVALAADQLAQRLPSLPADLITHARCSVAVGFRHRGCLAEAAKWFAAAAETAVRAPGNLQAMVARQRALLLLAQGKHEEALAQVRWAVATDRQHGHSPSISLINEGIVHFHSGRTREAVEAFAHVLTSENPRRPVYLVAIQNLSFALAEASRTAEEIVRARRILRTVRERIKGVRDTPIRYRVCWAEAILHWRLEEYAPALDSMQRARKGFQRLGMAHDFALISAELTALHLEMDQPRNALALLQQTAKALAGLGEAPLGDCFRQARAETDLASAVLGLRQRIQSPHIPA